MSVTVCLIFSRLPVMFLLSSESFLQAYKRIQYMKQYAKHRKMQGENIKKKFVVLEELNQGLLEDKKKKQALINQNKLAKTKLSKISLDFHKNRLFFNEEYFIFVILKRKRHEKNLLKLSCTLFNFFVLKLLFEETDWFKIRPLFRFAHLKTNI